MHHFTLTKKQFADLSHIIKMDSGNLAENPEFFKETGLSPKKYIAERISLCNALKIDFWASVDFSSQPYDLQRLMALYEGQSLKEFEKLHKRPTGAEFINEILTLAEEEEELKKKAKKNYSNGL